METITVSGFDGAEYVVSAISWVVKNQIRVSCNDINLYTQKVLFDQHLYTRKMFLACVKKNGSPLTDADIDLLDGKTGEVLDIAVHKLNDLSVVERLNLQGPLPLTTQ